MVIFGDENIVFLEEILSPNYNYHKYSGRLLNNKDLIDSNCEVLLNRSQTKINKELLVNSNVKMVATATSGTDHFDEEYLTESGIEYYSAKGSNANSVAEYVVFSILYYLSLKDQNPNTITIGIVGYGSIGQIVAKYAANLGINVIVNDPPLKDKGFCFPDYCQYAELSDLIENSTILTNHVPLNKSSKYPTYQLFNTFNISKFIDNGLVIHTSRGNVFEEKALHYLKDVKKCEIVVDVWANEPDFDCSLAKKSLISTPHIAGYSHNGKLNGTLMVLNHLERYTKVNINKELIINELNRVEYCNINDFNNNMDLKNRIEERRLIINDSLQFIKSATLDRIDKVKEFDNQRKNYPIKYELLSTLI